MILTDQHSVLSFGDDRYGQLGIGNQYYESIPLIVRVSGSSEIIAISAGEFHSLILDSKGQVFSFGENKDGQLGLGAMNFRDIPTLIETSGIGEIVAISAGGSHSLILNSHGQVFSFGSNDEGQLGLGLENIDHKSVPTLIEASEIGDIVSISASFNHSLLLNSQGQVFGFGSNQTQQLGSTRGEYETEPILIEHSDFGRIIAISAGNYYSLIMNSQGQVFGFGFNESGRLGLGNENMRPVPPTLIRGLVI